MVGLVGYSSDSESDQESVPASTPALTDDSLKAHQKTTSPDDVPTELLNHSKVLSSSFVIDSAPVVSSTSVSTVIPHQTPSVLSIPNVRDSVTTWSNATKRPNPLVGAAGIAERTYIPDFLFKKSFQAYNHRVTQSQNKVESEPTAPSVTSTKRVKSSRDPSDSSYLGPWAAFEGEEAIHAIPLTEEQKANAASYEQRKKRGEQGAMFEESAIFYGESYKDYQGNSFLAPPAGFRPFLVDGESSCFIPKNRLYTYTGHDKAVSSIEFFPQTGRFLLSASLDGTVRLWETEGRRSCIQLYRGHSEAVRTAHFSADGLRFLTVSYDKSVKIWDTETGKVLARVTEPVAPVCAAFPPNNSDEILVGSSKVTQWDLRTNEIIQEYKDSMASVNTITFLGGGSSFMTTSDDRRVLAYDYGVPVVIKSIQDTELHAIASVTTSPNGKYLVGNAQNNQALVFNIQDRVKLNRRKTFTGHICSGFACGLTFSPDGQFLCSGDAEGNLVFWDFKSSRLLKKIKAHANVAIDVKWHPADSNIVASCSWDNTIKLWK